MRQKRMTLDETAVFDAYLREWRRTGGDCGDCPDIGSREQAMYLLLMHPYLGGCEVRAVALEFLSGRGCDAKHG